MDVRNNLAQAQAQQAHDERQFQKYASERKTSQQRKVEDMESEHIKQIEDLTKQHAQQLEEIQKAYKVELSRTQEQIAEDLQKLRDAGDKRIEREKATYEETSEKLAARERAKVEHIRKNGENNIQSLHEKYQRAQEQMKGSG